MEGFKGVPALVSAVRDARAAKEAVEAADKAKRRRGLRCGACNRREQPPSPTSAWYPSQGMRPLTACRFTVKHTREILVGVGSATYHNERATSAFAGTLNKITSTRGVSLGARLAPRFYQCTVAQMGRNQASDSCYYIPRFPRASRTNLHPFNSSAPRHSLFVAKAVPGPGSYEICASRDRRIPFQEHLGSGRSMVAAVQVRCSPASEARCDDCGESPTGDFWRGHAGHVICRDCMTERRASLTRRARSAPQHSHATREFRKVRDCSEVHCHEGTGAAIRLRTERQQQRARVREAYLSLYFE